jgi:hypothetical protein
MRSTEKQVLRNVIISLVIGQAVHIVDSNCIVITKTNLLIYPCRATSRQPSTNFQHPKPTRPENSPHKWNPPVYGTKTQYTEAKQYSPLLPQKDVTWIQQLAGTLLYYVRALDKTLILPVNVLAAEQTQATAATADKLLLGDT